MKVLRVKCWLDKHDLETVYTGGPSDVLHCLRCGAIRYRIRPAGTRRVVRRAR